MKGKNERRNYGKTHKKNLKIDKENDEKLFNGNDNKERSNFVVNLICDSKNSLENLQRTPCSILAPLINSRNSTDDFLPKRRKAQRYVISLFDSPSGHSDVSCVSQNVYNEKNTIQNEYLNSKKKKKGRKDAKKNPIVKEFVRQCDIDWSEIEDFRLVIENVSKQNNKLCKQEDSIQKKERSLFENSFQNIFGCKPNNITHNKESIKFDLSKQENLVKTIISTAEIENTDLKSICISKVAREGSNLSIENVTNDKFQSLDFENISSVRESSFLHILTNSVLKHDQGLTTSTPNITPSLYKNPEKSCCRDAGLHFSCQRNDIHFKSKIAEQYLKPSLAENFKTLQLKTLRLFDIKGNVSSQISVDANNSFISKSHDSICACDSHEYHNSIENDLCQKKMQISASNNCNTFCDIPVQCSNNTSSDYSFLQCSSVKSNYSRELFSTLSLTKCILEQKENSLRETQFARKLEFEEEILHKNLCCVEQSVSQNGKDLTSHYTLSAICEDSYDINSELSVHTSADSSNESKLDLSKEQNQMVASLVSCKLQGNENSTGNVSEILESVCQFNSYCEFISFTHNISSCRENMKEVLTKIDIDSVEALEDMLHSEKNFIEEHASIIVLTLCNQTTVIPFIDVISPKMMPNVNKIGEGVYGEVFCYESEETKHVYKIVPIEGNVVVNGEEQKSYKEIMSEILISLELSTLSQPSDNMTPNFIQVNNIYCACGKYPDDLLHEWDRYADLKNSENERPDIFPEDQHFILFEFAYGGIDLESAELKNATEAKSVFQQVAFALAVAEQALEFEHRDLHWGNILVASTKQEKIEYIFQEECFSLPANGVLVSIIDFTLSYLRRDGCTIFTCLAEDPTLFMGEGDYQFDIYRMMKENNGNNWEMFNPYSNILWLDYLLKKLLKEKKYKNYKKHQASKLQLQKWEKSLLTYKSAASFVIDSEFFQSVKL